MNSPLRMKKDLLIKITQQDTIVNNSVNHKSHIDLGFSGDLYTWHNKRETHTATFSILDSAMANHFWINLYPSPTLNTSQLYYQILPYTYRYTRKFHNMW